MREADFMRQLQVEASERGERLFRNNVGIVKDVDGAYIRFGLVVGSGDLIGWRPVVITQAMVGSTIAQFTSVEVKIGKNKLTKEQESWHYAVIRAGGFSEVVYGS